MAKWPELACDSIKYYRSQWKFPYKLAILFGSSIHFLPSFDLNPHYFIPPRRKICLYSHTHCVRRRKRSNGYDRICKSSAYSSTIRRMTRYVRIVTYGPFCFWTHHPNAWTGMTKRALPHI